MTTIPCIWLSVDWDGEDPATYRGVMIRDGKTELSRHFAGRFRDDYRRAIATAHRINRGRIICLCDSVFEFRKTLDHHCLKRTKFYGYQGTETETADESGIGAPEACGDSWEDCEPPETPEDDG